jgi:hypothetical protein
MLGRVELGTGEDVAAIVHPAGDERLANREQRHGVALTSGGQATGGGPGTRSGAVEFGSCLLTFNGARSTD